MPGTVVFDTRSCKEQVGSTNPRRSGKSQKEEKNIDAVVVATPDHLHMRANVMAMEMGRPHEMSHSPFLVPYS